MLTNKYTKQGLMIKEDVLTQNITQNYIVTKIVKI